MVWGGTGDVKALSARLLFRVTAPDSHVSLALAGGVSRVTHGGAAYSVLGMATSSSGVVAGATVRLWMGPAVALRAELNDYVYTFKGARSTVTTTSVNPPQHDLSLSLGLSLTPLGHRGL